MVSSSRTIFKQPGYELIEFQILIYPCSFSRHLSCEEPQNYTHLWEDSPHKRDPVKVEEILLRKYLWLMPLTAIDVARESLRSRCTIQGLTTTNNKRHTTMWIGVYITFPIHYRRNKHLNSFQWRYSRRCSNRILSSPWTLKIWSKEIGQHQEECLPLWNLGYRSNTNRFHFRFSLTSQALKYK